MKPVKKKIEGGVADTRPMGLKMAYESMWSLLDNVSDEDIAKELERFKNVRVELNKQLGEAEEKLQRLGAKERVLKEVTQNRYRANLRKNFKLNKDHKTLVGMIYFGDFTREPELNYDDEELAKKLGWKLPNEYVSDEQHAALTKLRHELPYAIEEMLAPKTLLEESEEV